MVVCTTASDAGVMPLVQCRRFFGLTQSSSRFHCFLTATSSAVAADARGDSLTIRVINAVTAPSYASTATAPQRFELFRLACCTTNFNTRVSVHYTPCRVSRQGLSKWKSASVKIYPYSQPCHLRFLICNIINLQLHVFSDLLLYKLQVQLRQRIVRKPTSRSLLLPQALRQRYTGVVLPD